MSPVIGSPMHLIGFGTLEYRFRRKDGKYRWFADHFRIIKDRNDRPLFSEGIMRDVTEIKKAEEEKKVASKKLKNHSN